MNDFFSRLRYKFSQFMVGRYGTDQLCRFTMFGAFVFLILNLLFRRFTNLFYWLVWIMLIYTYFRMFSRNKTRRYNENTRYLELRARLLNRLRSRNHHDTNSRSGAARSDANHRIFRCPGCDQKVRVPRGHGRIEITCPRCGKHFKKNS